MYKKCFTDRITDKYVNEMESYNVWIGNNKIETPKIKYYKLKGKLSFQILIIDENGMNFLIDNYPSFIKYGIVEIKDEKLIIDTYYMSEDNPKSYYVGKLKDETNYGENRKNEDLKNGVIRYYVKNNWVVDNEKIEVLLDGYKEYHYDSNNRLVMEQNYKDRFIGIDKYGNQTFWDSQKQIIEHLRFKLGSMTQRFSLYPKSDIKLNKKSLDNLFDDNYWKNLTNFK